MGKILVKLQSIKRKYAEYLLIVLSYLINKIFYRKQLTASKKNSIKKILVVKLDHIGDMVLSTPVYHNLKLQFPSAELHVLANSIAGELLSYNPYVDRIINYDSKFHTPLKYKGLINDIKLLIKLKKERYDLIVDLRGNFLSLALALLKGSRYRADFGTNSIMTRKKLGSVHKLNRGLDILRSAGIATPVNMPEIYISDKEEAYIKELFGKYNLTKNLKVVFSAGAAWPPRRWPVENFIKLGKSLCNDYQAKILLIGSRDELKLNKIITRSLDGCAINLAGSLNLLQLAALLKHVNLMVSNDSGPAHIAAAMGLPLVVLFGPENPNKFRPIGRKVIVIQKKVECSPCDQTVCNRTPNCMELISVEEVYQRIKDLLNY